MEKLYYIKKIEDNIVPSELEVYEFTRTDGVMVLIGQSKLRFIGSVVDTPPVAMQPMQMPVIPAAIAPIVAPNPAPGKEVKSEPSFGQKMAIAADKLGVPSNEPGGWAKSLVAAAQKVLPHLSKESGPTEEQLEARRILAKMDPTILANAVGEDVVGEAEAPQTETEPAPKRKRRAKAAVETPAEAVGEPTDFKLSEAAAPEQTVIPEQAYYEVLEKVAPIEGLPTAEELKGFRARLFNLTSEVLPKGGMVPTEGIGGINAKVRLFVATMFPDVTDMKYLTKEQWEKFLGFMEGDVNGPGTSESLVAYIHERIGVKE